MDLTWRPTPKPSHSRKAKKRGDRSKFSKMVRDEIKEKYNNQCAMCSKLAFHVHHVYPRSRGGRNVYTNGLLLCAACHRQVHEDDKLLKHWIDTFKKKYGRNFYKDKEDLVWEYKTDQISEMDEEARLWVKFNNKWGISDEDMFR
jgi:5-methylcytosine-specific restriction endonuclease McrA